MPGTGFRFAPLSLTAFLVAGCSGLTSEPQLTADPCADLHALIAEYPNRFADLRGSRSDFRSVTLYRTKMDIVKGHCEVWEWAGGDSAYVCSVNAPDAEVAEQRYDRTVDYVGNCLGADWKEEASDRVRDGQVAGVVTRYRNPDYGSLVISVHNVSIAGAARALRSNYLCIGGADRSGEI